MINSIFVLTITLLGPMMPGTFNSPVIVTSVTMKEYWTKDTCEAAKQDWINNLQGDHGVVVDPSTYRISCTEK